MKEKIIKVISFCWKVGGFFMFWGLVLWLGSSLLKYFKAPSEKEKQEEQDNNPRTWVPMSDFRFKDSMYTLSIKIDSVVYDPIVEPKEDPY